MTGVLNPRLRVDNNFKIFNYQTNLINCMDFSKTELYEILWRPFLSDFEFEKFSTIVNENNEKIE